MANFFFIEAFLVLALLWSQLWPLKDDSVRAIETASPLLTAYLCHLKLCIYVYFVCIFVFGFPIEHLTKPSEHLIICALAKSNTKSSRETKSHKTVIKIFL